MAWPDAILPGRFMPRQIRRRWAGHPIGPGFPGDPFAIAAGIASSGRATIEAQGESLVEGVSLLYILIIILVILAIVYLAQRIR
jgi:hypothetical protein